jgi:hypothetical protein
MENINISEITDKIQEWGWKRDDCNQKAQNLIIRANELDAKIASAQAAIKTLTELCWMEPPYVPAEETSKPVVVNHTLNPDIQTMRWAKGELDEAALIVLRRN